MKPSRIAEVLGSLLEERWPAFVWGPPGAGKSSVVRQVAEARGMELIDIRAPLLDPTDLRGIPAVVDGAARWLPPSFLPVTDKPGVLFFDELNAAPPLVQASLYQLTLDRRVGEYELPDGWRIIAAGNRAEDRSVVYRMPAALANRFIHLEFEIDYGDWRNWAIDAGVDSRVVGFLGFRRELLFKLEAGQRGFPTPRSWEMVSDVLKAVGGDGQAEDILPGIVGEGAAVEFAAYTRDSLSEKQVRRILRDDENAALPEKLGDLYALVSYIAARSGNSKVRKAAAGIVDRLPIEMAVLMVRDVCRRHPAFAGEPAVAAFLSGHAEVLL